MPNLTNNQKINIASYVTDVILPDMFEEAIRAKEAGISGEQARSTILGIFAGIPGIGVFAPVALLSASAISFALSLFNSNQVAVLRSQVDNTYWQQVKRQIFCALPDSYIDSLAIRERLAYAIENIVPFNQRPIKRSAEANALIANLIRSWTSQTVELLFDYAADCWQGDTNSISECDDCQPSHSLIPLQYVLVPRFPTSLNIDGTKMWRLTVSEPTAGGYVGIWRLPYPQDVQKILGIISIQAPVSAEGERIAETSGRNGENSELAFTLTGLVGKEFNRLLLYSDQPFDVYVVLGDTTDPTGSSEALVSFETFSQMILEGSSATLSIRLYTSAPLMDNVTVDVNSSPPQGIDFTYLPTQVLFEAGSGNGSLETVTINVLSDTLDEGTENVVFRLANATGDAQIGLPNTHMLTITNQWEHTFDFAQSTGGFFPCTMPEAPVARGEYVAGTGWRTTPFNDNQMDSFVIGRSLPNTVSTPLTSITVETTDGVYYAAFYNRNAWIPIGERNAQNTADKSPVSATDTLSGLQMVLTNAFAIDFYSPDGSQRTLTRLTLRGTGSNPFV
jgi:hypothetical protein